MPIALERLRLDKEFWEAQQQELMAVMLNMLGKDAADEDLQRLCHFYIDLLRRAIAARALDEARRRM